MSDIPYYEKFLSPGLKRYLLQRATPVSGRSGLMGVGPSGGLETADALQFLSELHDELLHDLNLVLESRDADRAFIDQRCLALTLFNEEQQRDFLSPAYQTVLGLEDGNGRIVFGPKRPDYVKLGGEPIAPLPPYLQGPHVTLFGPPDTAKMAINAVNSYHRKLPNEPAIVEEILRDCPYLPKWGADDEDSKTPLRNDLIAAGENLSRCFDGTLTAADEGSGKKYELRKDRPALPIKRFPGLALPCAFLFKGETPVPLHLYDFALHVFHNWQRPEALVFYVPKLETEDEARYIHRMVSATETKLQKLHASYQKGTIRLMIVLENPRAIFRVHEIMDALYPYFAGASLGWHDYLASTARLFKEDRNYRIPSKTDPNIVIRYIKASHRLLADVVGPRGGIKVGGMYGVLPSSSDLASPSFQVTLKGYMKDVITQLKRKLSGFWVAHPDFVRIGLALVAAWEKRQAGQTGHLQTLIQSLLLAPHAEEVQRFVDGPDIEGLDPDHPLYARSLIVTDLKVDENTRNHRPEEIRYNVFQCLQYLADWLAGNGCVALPASLEGIPVRVMDDLATTERSRWEVWHEIRHGRFPLHDFLRIAFEELTFIRKDLSHAQKIVQVKWNEHTAQWYPIAFKLMLRFMTDEKPVEFVSELLLPFTVDELRKSDDPWQALEAIDPDRLTFEPSIERFITWFECLGHQNFAAVMSRALVPDLAQGENLVKKLSFEELVAAAAFHGDIGESKKTLDSMAAQEQSAVFQDEDAIRMELQKMGQDYKQKFGIKFLVSAQGKSGKELLDVLKQRIHNTKEQELDNARTALWSIARKRFMASPYAARLEIFPKLKAKHKIASAMISLLTPDARQDLCLDADEQTWFEVASLSKSVASAFALEYFARKGFSLHSPVNQLLAQTKSDFRLPGPWGDQVTLAHLMNHKALNLHYVKGVPASESMPPIKDFLRGNSRYGYEPVAVINPPGEVFKYSGAGFLVLEHVIQEMEGRPIDAITRPFLDALGMQDFSFQQETIPGKIYADGLRDDGQLVPGRRLMFPAFAAGAMGTSAALGKFLTHLGQAYHNLEGSGPLSHDTARLMLYGTDQGCQDFMGCNMGLGVFVAEAGDNRLAIHQGANDGFRCLYLYCFAGPDRGKGVVTLCNGDFSGVLFNAEVAQEALKLLDMQGVDFAQFASRFDPSRLKPEEVVNIGYRELVFKAFYPRLPEAILRQGTPSPLASFNLVTGARMVKVSNQLFGRAENLISPYEPAFDPALFGKEGKIMDSWETVRHNARPYDELILDLVKPGPIRYVRLSTQFHLGNQAAFIRLMGFSSGHWLEILPMTPMEGHAQLLIDRGSDSSVYTSIRVQNYPDGGFTRLGLYSDLPAAESQRYKPLSEARCERFPEAIPQTRKPMSLPYHAQPKDMEANRARLKSGDRVNVASAALGATVLRASNEHYGPAIQVVSPYRPLNMFDGLESARSRKPGHHEEVVIRLAKSARLETLVADFTYFVNNNPLEMSVQGQWGDEWVDLVPRTWVKGFAGSQKLWNIQDERKFEVLRVQTFPDGGLNRLLAFSRW
ncbi:MAG TPA: serine hydrolase [Oligoflexus sp.]|uniref:serine hydrolase n=1 Tax=Oligoflexus sp. TaxID=1971216 RepID=UPI002D32A74A|nr:serine hydrolase [Oligoflexus sp.]HYX34805.1 serine hydrolase [Oligoflexus sp.]